MLVYVTLVSGAIKKKLWKDAKWSWRDGNVNPLLHTHYSHYGRDWKYIIPTEFYVVMF